MNNPAFSVPAFGLVDTTFIKKSIGEIRLQTPLTLKADTPIAKAIRLYKDHSRSEIVVTNEEEEFIGVASLKKILENITPYHKESFQTKISVCVDSDWPTLQTSDLIEAAYDKLLDGNWESLPVISSETKQIVGILTSNEIASFLMESLSEDIMEVYYPD